MQTITLPVLIDSYGEGEIEIPRGSIVTSITKSMKWMTVNISMYPVAVEDNEFDKYHIQLISDMRTIDENLIGYKCLGIVTDENGYKCLAMTKIVDVIRDGKSLLGN